jgi:DNA-binding PadR family transcriptional regulator
MTTLGDVLLVLLADRGGTAHDIQQRHAATFGPQMRVDISRVTWTLTRQERLGYVRAAASPARSRQRRYELTETGARRQRMWLLRVPPDADPDDVRTRVLLAIEATDRATFDMVVQVCLAHLELSRLRTDPGHPDAALSPQSARAELINAGLAAEVNWLHSLRSRPRRRDQATSLH